MLSSFLSILLAVAPLPSDPIARGSQRALEESRRQQEREEELLERERLEDEVEADRLEEQHLRERQDVERRLRETERRRARADVPHAPVPPRRTEQQDREWIRQEVERVWQEGQRGRALKTDACEELIPRAARLRMEDR